MNKKEISEIRRRFNAEKSSITSICGCYVNSKKEIISEFSESLSLMPDEERDQVFSLLRHVLSGAPDRNLFDINISTQQVLSGEEHRLLSELRQDGLANKELVGRLYRNIIGAVSFEENFMVLLAHDSYDVPYRHSDGTDGGRESDTVFRYIICAVCPVKMTKPSLGFHLGEQRLRNIATDWVIRPPEMGFMFPAFDSRAANIYGARSTTPATPRRTTARLSTLFFARPLPCRPRFRKRRFKQCLATLSRTTAASRSCRRCAVTWTTLPRLTKKLTAQSRCALPKRPCRTF